MISSVSSFYYSYYVPFSFGTHFLCLPIRMHFCLFWLLMSRHLRRCFLQKRSTAFPEESCASCLYFTFSFSLWSAASHLPRLFPVTVFAAVFGFVPGIVPAVVLFFIAGTVPAAVSSIILRTVCFFLTGCFLISGHLYTPSLFTVFLYVNLQKEYVRECRKLFCQNLFKFLFASF